MRDLSTEGIQRLLEGLAKEGKSLEDYSPEELRQAVAFYRLERARKSVELGVDLTLFDAAVEKEGFLADGRSTATVKTYRRALERYLAWCSARGVHVAAAKVSDRDAYTLWLGKQLSSLGKTLSPASVRLEFAALHSWYNWLNLRHPWIENPFRYYRSRAQVLPVRPLKIPTNAEADLVFSHLRERGRLALLAFLGVLRYGGLRISGARAMDLGVGGRFRTTTKGRVFSGILPEEALALVSEAGLKTGRIFSKKEASAWEASIRRTMKSTARKGITSAVYSAHDFRHLFAVTQYRGHRDIERLRNELGHKSIVTTQRYLVGLGEDVGPL